MTFRPQANYGTKVVPVLQSRVFTFYWSSSNFHIFRSKILLTLRTRRVDREAANAWSSKYIEQIKPTSKQTISAQKILSERPSICYL